MAIASRAFQSTVTSIAIFDFSLVFLAVGHVGFSWSPTGSDFSKQKFLVVSVGGPVASTPGVILFAEFLTLHQPTLPIARFPSGCPIEGLKFIEH